MAKPGPKPGQILKRVLSQEDFLTQVSSLSDWVKTPPRDFRSNALYRLRLMDAVKRDPQAEKQCLSLASRNIQWCFETFFMTFDPRQPSKALPFIPWDYELSLLQSLDAHLSDGKDLLIEKSRDMGATWTVLSWLLYHWLFQPGFQALIGSRLEDLIDKRGDLTTHFERLRWSIKHLPNFLKPDGFDMAKHSNYMMITNPETSASIIGQAVSDHFSRQARMNVCFVDEFAFCESAEGAWRAMADSSPMRLVVSSANGLGNQFASLRRNHQVDVETLHWSKHPHKSKGMKCQEHGTDDKPVADACRHPSCKFTSPWYEGEKARRSAREMAAEIDIDYLSSGNPFFELDALSKQEPVAAKWRGFFVEVDLGIEFRPDAKGIWFVWDIPLERAKANADWFASRDKIILTQYAIGADPSEGVGKDWASACVRSCMDRTLSACLRQQLAPEEFAYELTKAGRFYNQARILCEREGPGYAVNLELFRSYGNIYYETLMDKPGPVMTKRFGFHTNHKTRPIILAQMAEEIRSGVPLRDERLIQECQTFVVDETGKARADDGYHDDLVFAWAIAGWGIQTSPKVRFKMRKPEVPERPHATSLV